MYHNHTVLYFQLTKQKQKIFNIIYKVIKHIQSFGPKSGAAVILPQFDNNNNNKLANQKIEMLAFPASSLGGLLRR